MKITADIMDAGLFGTGLGELTGVVDLASPLDEGLLRRAVAGLLRAFPVLDGRYVPGFWRDRWVSDEKPAESVVLVESVTDLDHAVRKAASYRFDLLTERPIRVTLLRSPSGERLVLHMPHQVADGNGVLTAMHELARQLAGSGAAGPIAMNRSPLQLAGAIGAAKWPQAMAEAARETARIFEAVSLAPWCEGFGAATSDRGVAFENVALDAHGTAAFHEACKAAGATVNDGLSALALHAATGRSRGDRVGVAYTINLRRFLPDNRPIVSNLSGFTSVVLPCATARDLGRAVPAVARITGGQKSRLPGVGSILLPLGIFGWLNHGFVHAFGGVFRQIMQAQARRTPVMTNVGVMDPYLAPLGDKVRDAYMAGPFVPGFPAPTAMATTFRGRLRVNIAATGALDPRGVTDLAASWRDAMQAFTPVG